MMVSNKVSVQTIRRKDLLTRSKNMGKENQWLKRIPPYIGWYFAGFVDGEGSFNVSVKRDPSCAMGWQVDPSFNVSQRDRVILALLKRYLGCGTLRERRDGVVYFEVRNLHSLEERVMPFFEKYSFLSAAKKRNFSIFKRIIALMREGAHRNHEGLENILALRDQLNAGRGRKRKYTNAEILS